MTGRSREHITILDPTEMITLEYSSPVHFKHVSALLQFAASKKIKNMQLFLNTGQYMQEKYKLLSPESFVLG